MDKKRALNAYTKMITKEKAPSRQDSDWLEQIAAQAAREDKPEPGRAAGAPHSGGGGGTKNEAVPEAAAEQVGRAFTDFAKIPVLRKKSAEDAGGPESKHRRVAKFLILIGAEQAASILANLDAEQVELISREIASIRGITKDEAADVFAEFQELFAVQFGLGGRVSGGLEEARRLLYSAFGPEKGERYLKNAVPTSRETSFSFLEDLSGEQMALLLRNERPATGAMILARIAPACAARALEHAEAGWKLAVVRRISHLGEVAPEVLEKTAEALREKARQLASSGVSASVDGMGALASILKQSDISFGEKLLAELEEADPGLGQELKERLYTMDDVVKADNRSLRTKLQEMNSREIAVLIKGRAEPFAEKILANISSNRRLEVREEIDFMGAIPKKESDAAIKEFMAWFRKGREEGDILMLGDDLVE